MIYEVSGIVKGLKVLKNTSKGVLYPSFFSWSVVEFFSDGPQLFWLHESKIQFFRQILSHKLVQLLNSRTLIGLIGMTKPYIGFQILGSEPVIGEFNAIVVGHRFDVISNVFELSPGTDMGIMGSFSVNLIQPAVTGFAIDDAQYGSFVGRTNDGVTFQVSDSFDSVDHIGTLVNESSVFDELTYRFVLSAAFGLLPCRSQMFVKISSLLGIAINMAVYGHMRDVHILVMFHRESGANADRFQIGSGKQLQCLLLQNTFKAVGMAFLSSFFLISLMSMIRIIVAITSASGNFAPNGLRIPLQGSGNIGRPVIKLNCAADVVSFPQCEVFVWLHVLDSLVGEKTEATKLREKSGGLAPRIQTFLPESGTSNVN